MSDIFEFTRNFLINLNPLWIYLVIVLVGLFIYWKGCTETRRNRSSIFDTFLISIATGLVVGRISYLSINWSEYSRYAWYFLPYERYGQTVYLFRLLPWRLLRVWDGGLTIFVAMITFLVILTLLVSLYKKWRWYQVYFAVFFSMTSMLATSFLYLGIIENYMAWIIRGIILFLVPVIFWAFSKIFLFLIENNYKRRKALIYFGVLIVTLTSVYTSYEYLSDQTSQFEFISVIILLIWNVISDIFIILDLNKPNIEIEKVSSVRAVDIEVNQPIRIK